MRRGVAPQLPGEKPLDLSSEGCCPLCPLPALHGAFCRVHQPGWVRSGLRRLWCSGRMAYEDAVRVYRDAALSGNG